MSRYIPEAGLRCPTCHELCDVVALDSTFSYSGTHCTNGVSGTHTPEPVRPVSDCCEADLECDSEEVCSGWWPDEDDWNVDAG